VHDHLKHFDLQTSQREKFQPHRERGANTSMKSPVEPM
jgi:hypothetical protein